MRFKPYFLPFRLLVGLVVAALLIGCAEGEEDGPIGVTAVDYEFQGLPERVGLRQMIILENDSDDELHELVAVRISDDEDRAVSELIELPEEALVEVLAAVPAMVIIARPGEEGELVLGDGNFSEPGRYAIVCFIPTGVDPDAYLAAVAANPDSPPQIEGVGPPHAVQGMYAEVIVNDPEE